MTEPTSAQDLFKGRHFDQEIIVLCLMDPLRIGSRAARQIEWIPLQALDSSCFRQPHSSASERVLVCAGPLRELRNSGVDLAYNTLK